jgi:hypothetical protein
VCCFCLICSTRQRTHGCVRIPNGQFRCSARPLIPSVVAKICSGTPRPSCSEELLFKSSTHYLLSFLEASLVLCGSSLDYHWAGSVIAMVDSVIVAALSLSLRDIDSDALSICSTESMYFTDLFGLQVGASAIPLDPSSVPVIAMIDSGTTYTYLPPVLYTPLVAKVSDKSLKVANATSLGDLAQSCRPFFQPLQVT